jgi:hypothetical protein
MLLQVDDRTGGRQRLFLVREREVLLLVPAAVKTCVVYLCCKTTPLPLSISSVNQPFYRRGEP